MLKSISYVSISKLVIILSQLFFVATFAKILPVEDLGTYVLALSVITPIAWALTFDVPIKIISNSLETKNLFIILFPNIFFLSALIFIFFLMSVFSVEVSIFYLLILLLLVLKIGEIVSEIYNADLRQEEKFIYFSLVSSIRFFTIYAVGAVTIISGYQIIFTILVLSILSLAFGLWSFYRLFKSGFYFKLNINDVMPYVSRNQSLGIASGMKFFSTNLMRYFVAFQFGINILGYLTPIFYGLTALSSISTVFENIISPKISKRLGNNKFSVTSNKYELSILLAMSIFIIIFTLLLSNYFYSFFFLDDKENYHYLLVVFSIGWFFYTSRGILKVISYRLKLQYLQIKIQFIFIFLLSVLMYIFSLFFGILGVSIAFVISNAMVCFYYIFQIKR